MIEMLPESQGATIGVRVSGKVDSIEENKWLNIFNSLISEHKVINTLIVLDGKVDVDLDAAYEDLKWLFNNLKHINKIAIVSQSKVLSWLVAADSPFAKIVGIDEKHFEKHDLMHAWEWVKTK